MSLYDVLITIHIFSAIVGLGPGFVMIYIVTKAETMTELRHAYKVRNRIHLFVMVGGTLLIITGIAMGLIRPYLFGQFWYFSSIILFLIALSAGPIVLAPNSKPIKKLLQQYEGEKIPETYYPLAKRLFFYERITNILFFIIILLMITKPL
ncbi:DUF2269 family protein [Pseudogracilibacillus sp. SE30717A]|uniref:DUF2269 family protein n=1 Tax=Pseudogracilibacillus sp. SE30717A TaxID=3098293 RepID=UPI00300DDF97